MTDDTYTWTNADGISVTVPGVHRRAAESHLAGENVKAFCVGALVESALTPGHPTHGLDNADHIIHFVYASLPYPQRVKAVDRVRSSLYGDHNPNAGIWLRVGAILREELEGVAV